MKIEFRFSSVSALSLALLFGTAARAEAPPLPKASPSSSPPTYHQTIAPILREHCVECHRPGQVAPFSLLTYDQARKRADLIATVTQSKRMPPWHASSTEGGPFRDARVLPTDAINVLSAWAEAGCPEGDASQAASPPRFESDWPLGKPDLVLTVAEPYELGAEGRDEFRVFVLPPGLTEGRWVTAVDFRPGNRRIVHHILGAFDSTGRARELDKADPQSGYHVVAGYGLTRIGLPFFPSGGLSGWAPGKRPSPLPSETGRYLPPGSDVLLQIHYHRDGKPETDATTVALYFAKEPIRRQIVAGMVTPPRVGAGLRVRPELRIPAGAANHEVRGSLTLRDDFHVNAVIPHMHWLGKDFLLTATKPDGSKITLIKIDRQRQGFRRPNA